MNKFQKAFAIIGVLLLLVAFIPSPAGAALYTKVAKYVQTSGSGVTQNHTGNINTGALRAQSIAEHPWYNITSAFGKTTVGLCKNVTPSFSGTALVRTIVVLNGELRAESKGLLKIPGGNPNAAVSIIVQANGKIITKTAGAVSNSFILKPTMTFNNSTYLLEMTQVVSKGVPVEICGGFMTNAAIVLGGGKATADFFSPRFANSYVQKLELIKK